MEILVHNFKYLVPQDVNKIMKKKLKETIYMKLMIVYVLNQLDKDKLIIMVVISNLLLWKIQTDLVKKHFPY